MYVERAHGPSTSTVEILQRRACPASGTATARFIALVHQPKRNRGNSMDERQSGQGFHLADQECSSSPNGVRTRVSTLRGWCPWPLDDGAGCPLGPAPLYRGGHCHLALTSAFATKHRGWLCANGSRYRP